MGTLAGYFLFSILTTINQPSSGRLLDHGLPRVPPPSPPQNHHQHITFFMSNVLDNGKHSAEPEPGANTQLPFTKPRGLFPHVGGPLPEPDTEVPIGGPGNHAGESAGWLPYLSSLNALEFGAVTVVDEELREGGVTTSPLVGRVRGIYVTIPEDTSSHMMAMTARFAEGEPENSIRFFGIHQTGASESHVAVIGGTGKYQEANGYATVKSVEGTGSSSGARSSKKKNLLVTVFLS